MPVSVLPAVRVPVLRLGVIVRMPVPVAWLVMIVGMRVRVLPAVRVRVLVRMRVLVAVLVLPAGRQREPGAQLIEPSHPRVQTLAGAQETSMTRGLGITRASASWSFARSTSRCGTRSHFVTRTRSAALNITGYLSGLSSPSVTERTTTFAAWPRS